MQSLSLDGPSLQCKIITDETACRFWIFYRAYHDGETFLVSCVKQSCSMLLPSFLQLLAYLMLLMQA